mgnify:CR=1 FL=1
MEVLTYAGLDMLVRCKHCGHDAKILSRITISSDSAQLYCECKDVLKCGRVQYFILSFSHFTKNQPTPLNVEFKDIPPEQIELFN